MGARREAKLDVSAIIPTFNRAAFLGVALESVLGQTRAPAQVIVVDDGSTDATPDIVARFGDRIEVLRQPNRGKAAALNHGLAQARGDAIWIFDDDDIADPRALERLTGALRADPDAGFAFGRHDAFAIGADGRTRVAHRDPPAFAAGDLYVALLGDCFFFQGATLVRRRCYDAAGPFDETLSRAQDYDMILRLARRFDGVAVDHILFHQRQHAGVRGLREAPIAGGDLAERQMAFDARVMRKAFDDSALADFLPRPATMPLSDPDTLRALLRRSALIGRRRLWDIADADLAGAIAIMERTGTRRLPAEATRLYARLFDRSTERETIADNPILRRITRLPPGVLRRDLQAAVGWPFLLGGLKAAARRDGRSARRQLAVYRRLSGARDLPGHLLHLARWLRVLNRKRPRLSAAPIDAVADR